VKAAQLGDPQALAHLQSVAALAKAGSAQGKAALGLYAALNTPLHKLTQPAPPPGAVLPRRGQPPVAHAVKKPAPSSTPAWLSARPMLLGGDPGKPGTWPKWMRDDYNAAVKARDPSVLGVASSMRPYAFLNRYGAAVASGVSMSAPSNHPSARLMLYTRFKSGDPAARTALMALASAAKNGNVRAADLLRDMVDMEAFAKQPLGGAVSGNAVRTAFSPPFGDSGAMSLHNYYQIGGNDLAAEQFYVGCAAAVGGCVPVLASSSGSPRQRQALDLVIGAGGQPLTRRWDGARWIWTQLQPHLGTRSASEQFGLRDAYAEGLRRASA
jgi:hypothetical protein